MAVTNYNYVNVEVVNAKLPDIWSKLGPGTYGKLGDFSKKAIVITKTPNSADFRLPFVSLPGGIHGTMDLAGGAYPSGTGPTLQQMVQTSFVQVQAFGINEADLIYTQNGSVSKHNMKTKTIQDALDQFREYMNIGLLSDPFGGAGRGLVAKATGYSGGTVTCANAVGTTLVRPGMRLEVYAADLNTHRTSGLAASAMPYVDWVSADLTQFKITNLGSVSPTSTDYFGIYGTGATPAWVKGLHYFVNSNTSGTKLGINIANFPALVSTYHNASSSSLSIAMGLSVIANSLSRRGDAAMKWQGIIHPIQAAKYAVSVVSTNPYDRKSSTELPDLAPKALGKSIDLFGLKHWLEPRMAKDTIPYLDFAQFGKVVTEKPGFVKQWDTGAYWKQDINSGGERLASYTTHLRVGENYFHEDPGNTGVIYGLDYTLS